ncbi:hypothetical protein [Hymenobacter sp. UYP22]|uniref:hypothetical protein n=1 Tax=Hymenobacter sp. UYP22 TaxID=3156348 RepID=UPI0033925CE7
MKGTFITILLLAALLFCEFRFEASFPQTWPLGLDYSTDFRSFAPLDTVVPRYEVFVSGEAHNIAGNEPRHFKLFAYLHQRAGVRHYVKEGSYTYVYFVDRYVQTGQPQWLDSAIASLRQTAADTVHLGVRSEMALWRNLRQLNAQAPADQKIQVVAIDTEPYWTNGLLRDLVARHPQVPAVLQSTVQELLTLRSQQPFDFMQLHRLDRKRMAPILDRAWALVQAHEAEARAWLGPDYRHLAMLVHNPAALHRSDGELANNFERLRQELPAGKFFLQYGRLHAQVHKTTITGPWLANALNQQHRVLSFHPYYQNCQSAWSSKAYPDERFFSSAEQRSLQAAATTPHTLLFTSSPSWQALRPYGQVFIVEKDLRF